MRMWWSGTMRLVWGVALATCVAADSCAKSGPCSCERDDGSRLDLKSALGDAPNRFFKAMSRRANPNGTHAEIDIYLFHPCGDANFANDEIGIAGCNDSSLCHRTIVIDKVGNSTTVTDSGYKTMFHANAAQFKDTAKASQLLLYSDEARKTSINLVCTLLAQESQFALLEPDSKEPTFAFYSPSACFTPPTNHHSFGTTLLIVAFFVALIYMIAGYCVKHFLMGAQGVEAIPNYNFWRELPDLVKDGIVFIQNGFRPPPRATTPSSSQSPNPNTYDSI